MLGEDYDLSVMILGHVLMASGAPWLSLSLLVVRVLPTGWPTHGMLEEY